MPVDPSETTRELLRLRRELEAADMVAAYALQSSEAEQRAALVAIREDLARFLGDVTHA